MKVLYISQFDSTGYGRASTAYAQALHSVGVDVVCRRQNLGGNYRELHPLVDELERKDLKGVTHVIQHTLPHFYQVDARFKQVGLFAWETSKLPKAWPARLNRMDAVVVFNRDQRVATLESGVTRPVHVVPHAVDLSRFDGPREPLQPLVDAVGDEFCFYGIGEWVARKNWPALVAGYHLAFPYGGPRLVLKCSVPGLSPEKSYERIAADCKKVRDGLGIRHRYNPEIILPDFLSDEQMLQLHRTCHCYVSTSHGEACNLGMLDALGVGNPVIAPRQGGFREHLTNESCCWLWGFSSPVVGVADSLPGLYTADQSWLDLEPGEVELALLDAHHRWRGTGWRAMRAAALGRAQEFSLENVGRTLRKVLEEV